MVWLGVDIATNQEIKLFNEGKEREEEIVELFSLEEKILYSLGKKTIDFDDLLKKIRNYSSSGLPFARYKELSDKLRAWDDIEYKELKKK